MLQTCLPAAAAEWASLQEEQEGPEPSAVQVDLVPSAVQGGLEVVGQEGPEPSVVRVGLEVVGQEGPEPLAVQEGPEPSVVRVGQGPEPLAVPVAVAVAVAAAFAQSLLYIGCHDDSRYVDDSERPSRNTTSWGWAFRNEWEYLLFDPRCSVGTAHLKGSPSRGWNTCFPEREG